MLTKNIDQCHYLMTSRGHLASTSRACCRSLSSARTMTHRVRCNLFGSWKMDSSTPLLPPHFSMTCFCIRSYTNSHNLLYCILPPHFWSTVWSDKFIQWESMTLYNIDTLYLELQESFLDLWCVARNGEKVSGWLSLPGLCHQRLQFDARLSDCPHIPPSDDWEWNDKEKWT